MSQNQNLIVWDEKFAIGIAIIDDEHKKLVSLCNGLYQLILRQDDADRRQSVAAALKECVDYTKHHFSHEEALMEQCGYDAEQLQQHKGQHLAFLKEVLAQIQNFDCENYNSSFKFVRFLYDWILSHIAHCDKLYVKDLAGYLRQKSQA